jgi:hypothetical protein
VVSVIPQQTYTNADALSMESLSRIRTDLISIGTSTSPSREAIVGSVSFERSTGQLSYENEFAM